jgi:AcrR family transcriptional regulator
MATVNSYTGEVPTPSKISLADVVDAARGILETRGSTGLTMQAVAVEVGVRAPSLYKHVTDRDHLVRLVAEATLASLAERMAATSGDLAALAGAFRRFAQQYPAGYLIVFSPEAQLPLSALEAAVAPLLDACAALTGPANALPAARTLTAWATGFIGMELAGQFNLGGDIDEAWEYGVELLVAGMRRS